MPKNFNKAMVSLYEWDFDLEFQRRDKVKFGAEKFKQLLDESGIYHIQLVIAKLLPTGTRWQFYHNDQHISLMMQTFLLGRNECDATRGWMTPLFFDPINFDPASKAIYKAIFKAAKSVGVDIDTKLTMQVINVPTTQIATLTYKDF